MHLQTALVGLLATGALASPLQMVESAASSVTSRATARMTGLVRQDHDGRLASRSADVKFDGPADPQPTDACPDDDDTWPYCTDDEDDTNDDDDDDDVLSRRYLGRSQISPEIVGPGFGEPPRSTNLTCYCTLKANDTVCDTAITETCFLDADLNTSVWGAAWRMAKPDNGTTCICETDGNSTCIPNTEFCMSVPLNGTMSEFKRQDSYSKLTSRKPKDCVCLTPGCTKKDGFLCFGGNNDAAMCDCAAHSDCTAAAQEFCTFNMVGSSTLDGTTPIRSQHPEKRQGVDAIIAPEGGNPEDTQNSIDGRFGIAMVGALSDDSAPPAGWADDEGQCYPEGWFTMTLINGVLTDQEGRRGYIASNSQLQFDDPPQAGAIYTGGFFQYNGALGLGQSYTFWACASGDFSNIYQNQIADYCTPIFLKTSLSQGECAADSTAEDDASEDDSDGNEDDQSDDE